MSQLVNLATSPQSKYPSSIINVTAPLTGVIHVCGVAVGVGVGLGSGGLVVPVVMTALQISIEVLVGV